MPHPILAPQFRRPTGLLGILVSNLMLKMNSFVYAALEEHASFAPGMRVLEIGYGPGAGLDYLIGKHRLQMDGVDFSPLMLKRASRRNRRHLRSGDLRLACADFSTDDCFPGRYDRVIFANVSYFWPELVPVFSKILGVLENRGKLVFYMSNRAALEKIPLTLTSSFHRHDIKDVTDSLERAGFTQVATHRTKDDSGNWLVVEATKEICP